MQPQGVLQKGIMLTILEEEEVAALSETNLDRTLALKRGHERLLDSCIYLIECFDTKYSVKF